MDLLDVVVGGQFGSEAKGHVAAILGDNAWDNPAFRYPTACRIGGPNAGHSVVDADGRKIAFRQLPVAAVNPSAALYIGPGSEIELGVLVNEMNLCEANGYSVEGRLAIHPQATILTEAHHQAEADQSMRDRVGSTAKGIGAARCDRLMRTAKLAQDYEPEFYSLGVHLHDLDFIVPDYGLIEGTQGYGLGLHAGYYPFCTSGNCRNVDFLAQSGWPLTPTTRVRTWVVFRTYPIRVAGNSGPMYDELTWEALAERTDGYIEPERTTVTKLVRRVGEWDTRLAAHAICANGGPNRLLYPVLTFVDYIDPALAEATEWEVLANSRAYEQILACEEELGVEFALFTTGPATHIWRGQ